MRKVIGIIFSLSIIVALILIVVYIGKGESPYEESVSKSVRDQLILELSAIEKDVETYSCGALVTSSVSLCDDSPDSATCRNSYYFYKSVVSGVNDCSKIDDERKGSCEAFLAGNCDNCEALKKFKDIVSGGEAKGCEALNFDEYVKCYGLIYSDENLCYLGRGIAQESLTKEYCDLNFEELPPVGRSFCEMNYN